MTNTPVVFVNNNNEVVTDSLNIAEVFGKQHKHVIRDIENLIAELGEKGKPNFGLSSYGVGNGREYKKYNLTKDGFTLLVMGFTGKEALKFKLMYIDQFNAMENYIKEKQQPKTAMSHIQLLAQGTVELNERLTVVEEKIETKMTIDHKLQRIMQNTVESTVNYLWNNGTSHGRFTKKQLFAKAYRRLKDRYGVTSYKDILEKDFEDAVNYMRGWKGE
ncbi:transcriptional regulator [Bacillus paranthracis]|nr:transcriptional regulator [Bacillus paranthracis]